MVIQDVKKTYLLDGRCRQRHRNICPYRNFTFLEANTDDIDEPIMPEDTITENDYRFNYTCCAWREGLIDWCREDAAKENDGDKSVRMWKFDLLRFSLTNHTKYRIFAFKLQAQLMALLPLLPMNSDITAVPMFMVEREEMFLEI